MRHHMKNLDLYRTLIQLARTSVQLNGGLGNREELRERLFTLAAQAKTCGFVVSEQQQRRLCERLAYAIC